MWGRRKEPGVLEQLGEKMIQESKAKRNEELYDLLSKMDDPERRRKFLKGYLGKWRLSAEQAEAFYNSLRPTRPREPDLVDPSELARELGIDRQHVIRLAIQAGVPIENGMIDRTRFEEATGS